LKYKDDFFLDSSFVLLKDLVLFLSWRNNVDVKGTTDVCHFKIVKLCSFKGLLKKTTMFYSKQKLNYTSIPLQSGVKIGHIVYFYPYLILIQALWR